MGSKNSKKRRLKAIVLMGVIFAYSNLVQGGNSPSRSKTTQNSSSSISAQETLDLKIEKLTSKNGGFIQQGTLKLYLRDLSRSLKVRILGLTDSVLQTELKDLLSPESFEELLTRIHRVQSLLKENQQ